MSDIKTLPLGKDDALRLARGDIEDFTTADGTVVRVDTTLDPDDDRLAEELDEARAEGFAAGLWFWSLMAVAFEEESHVEEWAEFFEGETAGDVAGVQG